MVKSWTVGNCNPMNKNKVFATFPLDDSAVETSGVMKSMLLSTESVIHILLTKNWLSSYRNCECFCFAKQTEIADACKVEFL